MLLFAQPVARIVRTPADRVATAPDGLVHIRFDSVPIELPAPVSDLVRRQLDRPGQASYVSHTDRWLFPGGIPGNHLATENLRGQLVQRGIQPSQARKAALFQLAGSMPVPVLADVLGLAPTTAARWSTLASRDWAQYLAVRHSGL